MVGLDNPVHILLILVVLLMVFGAKRLPEMGRGIGEGMRGFKQAISGETPAETHSEPVRLSVAEPVAPAAPTSAAAEREPAAPVA